MSAKILTFPRPAPSRKPAVSLGDLLLRRTDPSLSYHEREQIAVAIDMHRAAGHFLTLPDHGPARDPAVAAGATALEGALFHALCLKGCPNEDRELHQLLARRYHERTQA
tara:strand:+ start:40554 stop:40883 length:330 start_codon:yes stop_codon:yes gene_type:complete